jgi:hypothetical protein
MLRGASCYSYRVGRIDWSISDLTHDSGERWRFPWRFVVLMSTARGSGEILLFLIEVGSSDKKRI